MFPFAPQPDLYTSVSKDLSLLSTFRSSTLDLAHRFLGGHAANYESEIELFTKILYYGSSTLRGIPTWGEQYVEIMPVEMKYNNNIHMGDEKIRTKGEQKVTNSSMSLASTLSPSPSPSPSPASSSSPSSPQLPLHPLPPVTLSLLSPPRRVFLFLLSTVFPYIFQKIRRHGTNYHIHMGGLENENENDPIEEKMEEKEEMKSSSSSSVDLSSSSHRRGGPISSQSERNEGGHSLSTLPTTISQWIAKLLAPFPILLRPLITFFLRTLLSLYNSVLSLIHHSDYSLSLLYRLHLSLFYLYGSYVTLSHRIVGARFIILKTPNPPRPSYYLFGVLVGITMGLQGIGGIIKFIRERLEERRKRKENSNGNSALSSLSSALSGPFADCFSAQSDREQQEHEWDSTLTDENGTFVPPPTCPLCLENIRSPTSTECGHICCWNCIVEALLNKPQCPTCRTETSANKLILLNHYRH